LRFEDRFEAFGHEGAGGGFFLGDVGAEHGQIGAAGQAQDDVVGRLGGDDARELAAGLEFDRVQEVTRLDGGARVENGDEQPIHRLVHDRLEVGSHFVALAFEVMTDAAILLIHQMPVCGIALEIGGAGIARHDLRPVGRTGFGQDDLRCAGGIGGVEPGKKGIFRGERGKDGDAHLRLSAFALGEGGQGRGSALIVKGAEAQGELMADDEIRVVDQRE